MALSDVAGRVLGAGSRLVDRYNHIETAELLELSDVGYEAPGCRNYEPSRRTLLRATLSQHDVSPDDVFADLGSGKGRIVLDAAMHYPFRRVIGVEFLPMLTAIAERNVRSFRGKLRCSDIELVTSDVRDWVPPDDLTIAYMGKRARLRLGRLGRRGLDSAAVRGRRGARIDPRHRRRRALHPRCSRVRGSMAEPIPCGLRLPRDLPRARRGGRGDAVRGRLVRGRVTPGAGAGLYGHVQHR